MVHDYKRKTDRQSWSKDDMKTAIELVTRGQSVNSAAKQFCIPEPTLRRYIKEYKDTVSDYTVNSKY